MEAGALRHKYAHLFSQFAGDISVERSYLTQRQQSFWRSHRQKGQSPGGGVPMFDYFNKKKHVLGSSTSPPAPPAPTLWQAF